MSAPAPQPLAATAPAGVAPAIDARGLRLLFVVLEYPQLSESYIHAEIRWLTAQGAQVEVVSLQPSVCPGEATVPAHLGREKLAAVAARFQPHALHVHYLIAHQLLAREIAATGLPVTVRSHSFEFTPWTLLRTLTHRQVRQVWMAPHLVPRWARWTGRVAPARAVVDSSRYAPLPLAARDRRLVLRCGACLPTKDLATFVHVAATRPEYHFRLVLARNIDEQPTLGKLYALNARLGHPVEILENVSYPQMGEMMRRCGVYLHTFGHQRPFGEPVSLAEAMACGVPVLARRGPGVQAYLGGLGTLYDTVEEASAQLKAMLDWTDARWQAESDRLASHARLHHLDDRAMPPLLAAWRQLADGASGGRAAEPAVGRTGQPPDAQTTAAA